MPRQPRKPDPAPHPDVAAGGVRRTRYYMSAFMMSLKECGHEPEHIRTVLREWLGDTPAGAAPSDLTACANCLRPRCEHNGKLCPPPFTTHWHAWDYDHAQQTYPEYAPGVSVIDGDPISPTDAADSPAQSPTHPASVSLPRKVVQQALKALEVCTEYTVPGSNNWHFAAPAIALLRQHLKEKS